MTTGGNWNAAEAPALQSAPPAPPLSIVAYGVAVFIVGATAFSGIYGLNYVVQALGAFLALLFLLHALRARAYLSTEVFLYAALVGWAVTGAFVVQSPELFWTRLFSMFQIGVLLVIVCGQTRGRRELSLSLFSLLVGVVIVGVGSVLAGTYQEADERLTGLGRNANGFGRLMIFGTTMLMYFWMMPGRLGWLKYLLLGVPMVLAAMGCALSGSRFSTLGLGLLYLLWVWFCFRKSAAHQGKILLAVALGLAIGGYAFVSYVARSDVGQRFVGAWETIRGRHSEGSTTTRLEMYRIGLDLVVQNPWVGVGLGNFILYTPQAKAAHSELTEVPATTGVPGAALYFAIYAVLWVRAGRIRKYGTDPSAARVAGLTRAAVLTLMFIGLGAPNYISKEAWILLGSLMGYTNVVWLELRARTVGEPGSSPEALG